MADSLHVLTVLAAAVALSEWLAHRTFLRHVGGPLLVIAIVASAANLGVVPTYSPDVAVYDAILGQGVYVGIFLLLLDARLAEIVRAGRATLFLFAAGAVGTVLGVVVGMAVIDGPETIGPLWKALGGMFVATYTGGSANLNMIAAEYDVARDFALYTGANAVDAIVTTVWMMATIVVPRALGRVLPRGGAMRRTSGAGPIAPAAATPSGLEAAIEDGERLRPVHLGVCAALGAGGLWVSRELTGGVNAALEDAGIQARVPMALVLTTIALGLAQLPVVTRLAGKRVLGVFAVYLFLAVIGALCDLSSLERLGSLAGDLFVFAGIVVTVHGLVCFGAAGLARLDWDVAAVASQANVGGGTTAPALARSLGRSDLVLPGILVGSLGTATGTYLGILAVEVLLPAL